MSASLKFVIPNVEIDTSPFPQPKNKHYLASNTPLRTPQNTSFELKGERSKTCSISGARCLHVVTCIVFNDHLAGKMKMGLNSVCFVQVNH